MSWSSDMAKFVKEKKEQKRQEAESMQNRIFFTAVSVDLEEDADPSSPFQGFKLVPGIHIPKDYKENLAKQKDAKYQEFLHNWIKEKDPERKKQIGRAAKEYWAVRRKELGFLDEEDIKRLEEEKRKREEEERKRRELEWQEHLAWVEEKIAKGTPAKHVLYCNYPGAEFREEIDASKMESSYTEDYDGYREELDEILSELLGDQDFEKFVGRYFTEDDVPASGHLCYDEVRTEVFGNGGLPLNDDVRVYLDSIGEDGTVIDTEELDISDYIDLESEKEFLMECGLYDQTDEYIEIALRKFVEASEWHYELRKGNRDYEDVETWPAPKADGSWADSTGETLEPYMWFGNWDEWVLDGDNLDFWLSDYPEGYIIERHYDAYPWYGGGIPGFEEIVKSCPVKIEADDTPESIDKKIRLFFVEQYKKAHLKKRGKKEDRHA